MDFDEIGKIIYSNLSKLHNTYSVKEIGIFGSFARGDQTPESDIDILVEFYRPVGFVTFMRLEKYLEQILCLKVDLVTKRALKPRIGKHILREVRYVA